MAALFKRIVHAGVAFGTRRIMREAIASAIVTLVVTAAFSGMTTAPKALEPAVGAAAPRLLLVATGPSAEEVAKTWFDPTLVQPGAHGFRRTVAVAKPVHRRGSTVRLVVAPARSAVPAGRPAETRSVARLHLPIAPTAIQVAQTQVAQTQVAQIQVAQTQVARISQPQLSAAEPHGFQVFGQTLALTPGDLLPSPSSLLHNVKGLGGSIVGLASGF